MMTFDNLSLHPKILKAVLKAGYTTPTSIQQNAIPKIIEGCDMRASANTGTGKTAAFLLPILHKLANKLTSASPAPGKKRRGPLVLVLVPTRELGMQIAEQAKKYTGDLPITTVCIGGGVPLQVQQKALSQPYDILIATPGRLIDFMSRRKIDLSSVEMLVLDEADRMLDMGFIEPVEDIVAATPETRQTLLFSATLQGSVRKLSDKLLKDPVEIVVHAEHEKHANIRQVLHYVDDLPHKNRLLEHILSQEDVDHAIVFTSTKRHADQLVEELQDKGLDTAALHGDMSQRQRTQTIKQLRNGTIRVLVATDVAARGIDVQSITHVINFDLPRNIEDYVHRIGRTGRAGAKGTALSFAVRRDAFLVKRIEKFTGHTIDVEEIAGFEPRSQKSSSGAKKPRFGGGPRFSSSGNGPRFGGGNRSGGSFSPRAQRKPFPGKQRPSSRG